MILFTLLCLSIHPLKRLSALSLPVDLFPFYYVCLCVCVSVMCVYECDVRVNVGARHSACVEVRGQFLGTGPLLHHVLR